MQRNRNDVIAEIETARDEARITAHAYVNLTDNRYNYWRAVAAFRAYDRALVMFARATEHKIPGMAAKALADFARARDGETTEMALAVADGRRDALATVADWMNNEESNR